VARPEKEAVPVFPGAPPASLRFLFSPDGTRLLIHASYRLLLMDVAEWKPVWDAGFQEIVGNVAFASDSRHLAVTLTTGVIYVVRLGPATLK
jgi:hypothetical protein